MDRKELADLSEEMMPRQYRWCNRVYEIGKLLHPEVKKEEVETTQARAQHGERQAG